MDYVHMNKVVRKHKAALTRARNSGDMRKVIAACDAAFDAFDAPDMLWPDNWHMWNIARQDAVFALRMAGEKAEDRII